MARDIIEQCSVERISVLDEKGNADMQLMPPLSDDDIRTLYWYMNLSRFLNTKMLTMQKQGRLGTFASVYGQEGCQVALSCAVRDYPNIWLVPSFRENAALLARGVPMEQLLRYWGGYEQGSAMDDALHVLPVSIPVGSQLTHAVGIAQAMTIRGEQGAAVAFFGDGATSEGEAHEALNFAGVLKAPVIFFCQNNQYAISFPRERQTASKTLAQKAWAYGYPGVQVDGNDVFATYRVVKEAVERAFSGNGPTFIEAVTYRMDHHTTADDWRHYRREEEVQQWALKDPILRLRTFMLAKGIWNDEHEKGMIADAEKRVEAAVHAYEATPKPQPGDMFDFLFAGLPPQLQEQKRQWTAFWGER